LCDCFKPRRQPGSFVGSDFAMPDAPDFQPMYNAIAAANTSWSRVENAMASLLEWLLGYSTSDGLRLTKAFIRIENARLRRRIVDLVQEIAPEDDTKWVGVIVDGIDRSRSVGVQGIFQEWGLGG